MTYFLHVIKTLKAQFETIIASLPNRYDSSIDDERLVCRAGYAYLYILPFLSQLSCCYPGISHFCDSLT